MAETATLVAMNMTAVSKRDIGTVSSATAAPSAWVPSSGRKRPFFCFVLVLLSVAVVVLLASSLSSAPSLPRSAGETTKREAPGRDARKGSTGDDDNDDDVGICELSKYDFRSASGVFAIVTGCHHSGTTLTSQLVMSAPNLFGAVECGLLCPTTPKGFVDTRYYSKVIDDLQWKLTNDQRASLVNSTCHAQMYDRLKRHSPLFQSPVTRDSMIVDKTPMYIYDLVAVMDRSPGVPVVVTRKDDEDQMRSCRNRRGDPETCNRVVWAVGENLRAATEKYPHRIHVVNATQMLRGANNIDNIMSGVYDFLNVSTPWDSGYLTMDAINSKVRAVGLRELAPFQPDAWNNSRSGPAGTTQRFKAQFELHQQNEETRTKSSKKVRQKREQQQQLRP